MSTWLLVLVVAVPAYLAGVLTPLLWFRLDARRTQRRRQDAVAELKRAREWKERTVPAIASGRDGTH